MANPKAQIPGSKFQIHYFNLIQYSLPYDLGLEPWNLEL